MAHTPKHTRTTIDSIKTGGNVSLRAVPELSAEEIKALNEIRTNDAFTLEKSSGMYVGIERIRPSK